MRLLNRIPLTQKLRIYLYIVLIAVLLFAVVLFAYLFRAVTSDSYAQMERLSGQISVQLVSSLRLQQMLVTQLAADATLKNFIQSDYSMQNAGYPTEVARINLMVQQIKEYLPDSMVRVFNDNATIKSDDTYLPWIDDALGSDWINEAIVSSRQNQGVYWGLGSLRAGGAPHLICYKGIYSNQKPYELRMIVAIGIRQSDVLSILSAAGPDTGAVLMSGDHRIGTAPDTGQAVEYARELGSGMTKTGFVHGNGGLQIVSGTTLSDPELSSGEWRLALVRPFKSLVKGLEGAVALWLFASAVLLILLVVLTRVVTRNIVQRSQTVLSHIRRIASEDFTHGEALPGRDEFNGIDAELNRLADRLAELIENEYKRELLLSRVQIENQQNILRRQEAEIVSLQNQINPHYFFNTLEAIRMNLLVEGDDRNSEMVHYFAESLRTYSRSPHNLITVREELEFLERYIKLQNYRYLGKLTFTRDVGEDVLDCAIPPFLLQPLFENSIRHGFSKMTSNARIHLSAVRDGDLLRITVSDNGSGIENAALGELRERLALTDADCGGESIGLINVHRRLRLMYGKNCGVSIDSEAGRGTRVEARVMADGGKQPEKLIFGREECGDES